MYNQAIELYFTNITFTVIKYLANVLLTYKILSND